MLFPLLLLYAIQAIQALDHFGTITEPASDAIVSKGRAFTVVWASGYLPSQDSLSLTLFQGSPENMTYTLAIFENRTIEGLEYEWTPEKSILTGGAPYGLKLVEGELTALYSGPFWMVEKGASTSSSSTRSATATSTVTSTATTTVSDGQPAATTSAATGASSGEGSGTPLGAVVGGGVVGGVVVVLALGLVFMWRRRGWFQRRKNIVVETEWEGDASGEDDSLPRVEEATYVENKGIVELDASVRAEMVGCIPMYEMRAGERETGETEGILR